MVVPIFGADYVGEFDKGCFPTAFFGEKVFSIFQVCFASAKILFKGDDSNFLAQHLFLYLSAVGQRCRPSQLRPCGERAISKPWECILS